MKPTPQFKSLYSPMFTIEDIVAETRIPAATLRMWVTRKIISLSSSYTPGSTAGRGTKAMYSPYDAMQFLFIAQSSKQNINVKSMSESCLSEALEVALDRLSEMDAGVIHGDARNPTIPKVAYMRYVFIYEHKDALTCTQNWGEWKEQGVTLWTTFDALDFAARVYAMYKRKQDST